MGKVVLDMVVSVDGYVAGPDDDDEGLHDWVFSPATREWSHSPNSAGAISSSAQLIEETIHSTGAAVMGRRMHDIGDKVDPNWDGPYKVPHFIVTHDDLAPTVKGGCPITYVNGVVSAVAQAKSAAGERDVTVLGGANIAQQCIAAGVLDEIRVHVSPFVLNKGIRLFDGIEADRINLEILRVVAAADVTHIQYRVVK